MKRIIVTIAVLLLGAASSVVAAGDGLIAFDSSWTIHELAGSESVPVKNLAAELELDLSKAAGRSLVDLGISRTAAADAIESYREGEPGMVGNIVAVGMTIVFASLVVVALLISLFRHLHIFGRDRSRPRSRSVKSVVGTITSKGDLSARSIAAVVAAIFLHEEEVDAENRLLLTWRRASTSVWRTGGAMPNSSYFATKRGR